MRLCGYRTDAVEFVSSEHTDRNLLLRAVRRDAAPEPRMVEEYQALKRFWNVTPYLETLLQREATSRHMRSRITRMNAKVNVT